MNVLAIDPGTTHSAYYWHGLGYTENPNFGFGRIENDRLIELVETWSNCGSHGWTLAIEMIASYGMPVGREVFETCVAIGRMIERWGGPFEYVYRRDVKLHLCGSARAKDANVRQALIDRFGGREATRKGGPLYGVKGDIWSALAVAVTYSDKQRESAKGGE